MKLVLIIYCYFPTILFARVVVAFIFYENSKFQIPDFMCGVRESNLNTCITRSMSKQIHLHVSIA